MSDGVDLQDFVPGFIAEAEELLAIANAALLEIEAAIAANTLSPRAVRDLFRALHTLKGLAGMIGVEPVVEIAHALETLVRAADRAGGRMHADAAQVSLHGVQAIAERVRAVAEQRPPAPAPERLLAALAATDASAEAPAAPPPITAAWDARLAPGERQQLFLALRAGARVWSVTFEPSEARATRGISIATVRARLAEIGEIIKVVPCTHARKGGPAVVTFDALVISDAAPAVLADLLAGPLEAVVAVTLPTEHLPDSEAGDALGPSEPDVSPLGRAVLRVELARLDELQEQLSQLIVSRFRIEREIARLGARGADVRGASAGLEAQGRQLRELRRAILRARLVSVVEVLEPLALLVRSLGRPGVRELRLELEAGGTKIDKAVADRILPAVVHLIRNAADHAIETPAERRAAGKPAVGLVRVACRELGAHHLELDITDDGRGIDRAALGRRVERDLTTDAALLDVLTRPGFTTRDVATATSGRGLGMDIARRIVVADLGGDLRITTRAGAGTAFHLRVPLTIAIVDAFSFRCGVQAFVVPVGAVEEIFELTPGDAGPGPAGAVVSLIERRGRAMPLVSLGRVLALGDGRAAARALVVRVQGEAVAFAVDHMLGRQEVVVRPLEDPLARAPGIAGATDLGDGQPTLVLDLAELGDRLQRQPRRAAS